MSALGKSLQNSKKKKQRSAGALHRHRVNENVAEAQREADLEAQRRSKAGLKSIWETNQLEHFLDIADAREDGYYADRNVKLVIGGTVHVVSRDRVVPEANADAAGGGGKDWLRLSELLTVPKRPPWDYTASAAQLDAAERTYFADWRRSLAMLEEEHAVTLTPYEKNLEVWRQLWRVVERADVVCVIVDARNPLVFRSKDFEEYVGSHKDAAGAAKRVVLLLNKADLLTESQRRAWAEYFTERGDAFYFFSAKPAEGTALQEEDAAAAAAHADPTADLHDDDNNSDGDDDDDEEEEEEETVDSVLEKQFTRERKQHTRHKKKSLRAPVHVGNAYELAAKRKEWLARSQQPKERVVLPPTAEERARDARAEAVRQLPPWHVMDPVQLLDCLALLRPPGHRSVRPPQSRASAEGESAAVDEEALMVGLVGYPNVGKSSTINAIIGAKRVVVSATPGKTKHFQTLAIPNERRVALCDCPGLVFPTFASTKEQMVCDGILPIDTATDPVQAAAIVCRRLPRRLFEAYFALSLAPEDDCDDSHSLSERLLNALARRRGYMSGHDRPNKSRAARELLKLFVDGALVYVEPPPTFHPDAAERSLARYLESRAAAAGAAGGSGKRGKEEGSDDDDDDDDDDDEYEDLDSEEEQAWADLEDAEERRAPSDPGRDQYSEEESDTGAAAAPMFYGRPAHMRELFTRYEYFNIEANEEALARLQRAERRRKKRTNHQLEPDVYTFVNRAGEVELILDDDDGVLEIVQAQVTAPSRNVLGPAKQKKPSKRQQRREMKKTGASAPVNPSARRVGINDY